MMILASFDCISIYTLMNFDKCTTSEINVVCHVYMIEKINVTRHSFTPGNLCVIPDPIMVACLFVLRNLAAESEELIALLY